MEKRRVNRIFLRKVTFREWYKTNVIEHIDVTDMPIEELWAMRQSLDRTESLEVIIDKIIKRLPAARPEAD